MPTLRERFEKKYIPEPMNGCWIWIGAMTQGKIGYGMIHDNVRKKTIPAHRIAWELFNGAIPEKLNVLHRCDVMSCVNPNHLFLGTQSDNMVDAVRKNRLMKKGIDNGRVKLTEPQVLAIQLDPRKNSLIAAEYSVSHQLVSRIKRHECWRHLDAITRI